MSIYLDDQAVELDGATLGDVLSAAAGVAGADGRVLVEVKLGGELLTGDALEAQKPYPVGEQELRLTSVNPLLLAAETLAQVRERLGEASFLQEEAAELLQQDEQQSAFEKIQALIAIWLQAQQAVLQSAQLTGLDLEAFAPDGNPASTTINGLLERLKTLKDLIVNQDTVGVADALAYEWPETTEHWDRLVEAMAERMREQAEGR